MPTIENARYFCQGCRQAFAENDLQAVALKSTDEQTGVCNDCRQPLLPEQFVRALKGQQIHNWCLFNLQGADLGGAYLERAYLERTNLEGADLDAAGQRIYVAQQF